MSFIKKLTCISLSLLVLASCGRKEPIGICVANQTAAVSGQQVSINDNATFKQLAQTFISSGNQTISSIQAYLYKVGSPNTTDTITAEIWSNNTGTNQPGSLLSTGSVQISQISTAGSYVSITIASVNLTKSTSYWLVLRASYAGNASNLVAWAETSGTTDVATDGQAYYVNYVGGASYQTVGANRDFTYRIGDCGQ